jgi:RimJ/RimL family protein N-acetyltransferase
LIKIENELGFACRSLSVDEADLLRNIRLEALKKHPEVYGVTYDETVTEDLDYWENCIKGTAQKHPSSVFGLFDPKGKLIGMTGVVSAREDSSGKTAKLCASYIKDDYKGNGLSKLLYQARLEWIASQPCFEKVIVSHRKSNVASQKANQAFGFSLTHEEPHEWSDGSHEPEVMYELKLPLFKAQPKS